MSQSEIHIKQVESLRVLTLRFTAQNHRHFAQVWAEIRAALQANSFQASGHPIQIIYADEYLEDNIDTEIILPTSDTWMGSIALASSGTMTVRELSGATAASYLHSGDPKLLNDKRIDLQRWTAAYGYKLGGSMRMVYLRGLVVRLPVEEWLFEIQHPLEKLGNDVRSSRTS